mgnify:CR=1 FL=1
MQQQPQVINIKYLQRTMYQHGITEKLVNEIISDALRQGEDFSEALDVEITKLMNRAINKGITSATDGTVSEKDALKILGKSKDYFSVRNHYGKPIPSHKAVGNQRRYTITDLATWNLHKLKVR